MFSKMAEGLGRRKQRRRLVGMVLVLATTVGACTSCAPGYVARAGFEEAKILWRRQEIAELVASNETEESLKRKLALVLEARDFAERIGLKPEKSFTKYSKVDRDDLLWVLSATQKTSFDPYTWWFPIVGTIPYKGFFDKDDAVAAGKKLEKKGLDIYIRSSPAFSTLGWFNDPLLSTTIKFDDISIVDTVIHEILHNTIWVKNNVPFNESLANFVGARGVEAFFAQKYDANHVLVQQSQARWKEELEYARFLSETVDELKTLYAGIERSEIVEKRKELLARRKAAWDAAHQESGRYRGIIEGMNNAVIMAHQVYLTEPWLFEELYSLSEEKLPIFLERIKQLPARMEKKGGQPYEELRAMISELRAMSSRQ